MKGKKRLPLAVKVIVGFHLVSFVLWLFGQTGAVLAYDTVAAWGFQEPRTLTDPALVEVNRAIGLTDTFLMLPLYLVATVGLHGGGFITEVKRQKQCLLREVTEDNRDKLPAFVLAWLTETTT